jgi:hypothetical protein
MLRIRSTKYEVEKTGACTEYGVSTEYVVIHVLYGMRSTCINTCITAARNLKGVRRVVSIIEWEHGEYDRYSGVFHTAQYSAILTVPYGVWECAEYGGCSVSYEIAVPIYPWSPLSPNQAIIFLLTPKILLRTSPLLRPTVSPQHSSLRNLFPGSSLIVHP